MMKQTFKRKPMQKQGRKTRKDGSLNSHSVEQPTHADTSVSSLMQKMIAGASTVKKSSSKDPTASNLVS